MEEIKEEKNLCCKETIQKCPTPPQLTKIPNAKPTPRFNFEPIAKPRINIKPLVFKCLAKSKENNFVNSYL